MQAVEELVAGQGGSDLPAGGVTTRRMLFFLLPATTAAFATYNGVQQILMPAQVQSLDPAAKVANLALLTTGTTLTALIGLLVGGALSDRTYSRWGRRTPWLVLSALASAILLVTLGTRTSLAGVAAAYLSLWFTANVYLGALTPIIVDRIPNHRRGVASAVIGLGVPLGILIGINFVARVTQEVGYCLIAGLLLATTALLVTCAPEGSAVCLTPPRPLPDRASRRPLWARAAASFSSFRSADFTYAFLSRAMILLAFHVITGYQYYLLQDYIGVANLPRHSPAVAISLLTTFQTFGWMIATAVAGWLADRWDRKKMFVGVCSLGAGIALMVPVISPTWPGMMLFQTLFGIFFGTYWSVDLALISLVLPHKEAAGRDMGIMNLAHVAQLVAPSLAGALIVLWGYGALFGFSLLAAGCGAILVFRIRSVR
jgi:MFS family permease